MKRLVVVSNRLPVVLTEQNGRFDVREGAGGLVTALKPLLEQRGGAWIGFCGMYEPDRGKGWEETLAEYGGGVVKYHALVPPQPLYDGYYLEYSNQELWPRFHSLTGKMQESAAEHWDDYLEMNRRFAELTEQYAGSQSAIWIQDYHLMLLPEMLRRRLPEARLGHFLHTPFPPVEIMRQQPHAEAIMRGVMGADVLGFHIPAYMEHFAAAAEQILGARLVDSGETEVRMEYEGRQVTLGAFPIGIRPDELQGGDTQAVRARLPGAAETLILSMDRLDYTKAIPPRLEAYANLLELYPEYREHVTLVQLIDLSRKQIPAYQEEREKVERIVARIEAQYQSWKSLFFSAERWPREEVAGLMRMSRVCVVTPRCDGMNLVCKEYVAAAPDDGALVLSRQAGAAWQFGAHAILVDGNSPEDIVAGLRTALEMPEQERRARMAALKENVRREDVFWWAGRFLDTLQGTSAEADSIKPRPALDELENLLAMIAPGRCALLLDYDGTLTPIVRRPEDATLPEPRRELLRQLAAVLPVAVVSGRDLNDVARMVGIETLIYAGSHGFDIRGPQVQMQHREAQQTLPELDQAEADLRAQLQEIPGVRVERKQFAIAVHYRDVEDEQAVQRIEQIVDAIRTARSRLRMMGGKKIFELQPDVSWDKGRAILWLAQQLGLDGDEVTLIYIGDDVTDEYAFRALRQRPRGIGIRVADALTRTAAPYYLRDCDEADRFLNAVLNHVTR